MGYVSQGVPARQAAFRILNEILFKRRSMDEAFSNSEIFEKLEGRDRAFVRVLVSVVLKRTPEMDGVIHLYLQRPVEELKPYSVMNIFRLAIAQLVFLQTPQHAVVNTAVELAAAERMEHQKSFVNAVLRRLIREGYPMMSERDAGKENTPEWLWQTWVNDYGVETALHIAEENLSEAAVDVSVKGNIPHWAEKLEAEVLPSGSLRRTTSGFIPDMEGFAEGEWWIQSASAALPAKLFGDIKGKTVVDMCAAPGGKTAQLAVMGAHVIAVDRSAERLRRLHENMARLKLTVETVAADGAVWQPKEKVDAVLLDAPCSATGTIRHQPDVLHLKDNRDEEKLSALQRRLLINAAEMLKTGGVLVYCTCSLQKIEAERQAEWFLQQGLPFALSPIRADEIEGIEEMITPQGELRVLPFHWKERGGMDGFYIARFVRL